MSWAELLKALPDPVSLPGLLLNDEGLAHLITQAEGEDKTNILSTRKKANELKSGKNIPDGLDAEAVQANAEKLVVKLNEIIRAANRKSQEGKKATLEDKLTHIIEEEDKSGLMEFVTTTPVRKWSNKVKDRKKKLLEDNKKAILEFIELDDTDLFYFNTSEFSLTATKPTGDTNWETKINELKSGIKDTGVKISGDDTVTIEFTDVTSWPDMKTVLDIAQIRMTGKGKSKATAQENILLFEKQGKFTKSPLLELYVKGDAPKNVQDKVIDADIKNYVNNVSDASHALSYLKCVSYKGLRKDIMFMPVPLIQGGSKKITRDAKVQLLGSELRPAVSASLAGLLKSSNFDLSELVKEGMVETETKYVSPRLRTILESDDDVAIAGLTAEQIAELKTKFKKIKELPLFISRLKGTQKTNFDKLNNELIGKKPNLFNEKEKEFFESLKDTNPITIKRKTNDFYKTQIDTRIARLIGQAVSRGNPFTEVEGGYKFDHKKIPMEFDDLRDLVYELKILRQALQSSEEQEDQEKITLNLEDSLKTYTKGFKVNQSGSSNPADMLHFLYVLDLYYGRTPFKSLARKFKRGQVDSEEVLKAAKDNFSKIIEAFVGQVKTKIDDILADKEKYQRALTIDKDSKAYKLFDTLEKKGLIQSSEVEEE